MTVGPFRFYGSPVAKVAVVSGGYRGDVLPYVPIARMLARRGHDVRVVVPADFHALLADEPFEVPDTPGHDLGPSFLAQYARFMARWGRRLHGARVPGLMLRAVTDRIDDIVTAIEPHARWADVGLLHPVAALSAGIPFDGTDTPWICGDLFPMLLPSAAAPPMGMPDLGPRANRLAWNAAGARAFDGYTGAKAFRERRARYGLPDDGWTLVGARCSPHLNLGLASRHYVDPQPDWPQDYELVGFTPWEGHDGEELADDIQAFLDDGPTPVAVCLGSSAADANPKVFEQVAEHLDRRGQRGIFLVSTTVNAERLRTMASSGHGIWPFAPLAPILERSRAVIQSGAHGTNALALLAGLPSVVVPTLEDQVWHGKRQEHLGTGILARRRLAPAIDRLLEDDDLTRRARALGEQLRAEDGVTTACDRIEAFLAVSNRS